MKGDETVDVQSDLDDEDIEGCLAVIAVIAEGEAVDLPNAKRRLPQSVLIALKRDGHEIVAVGAIKPHRLQYAAGVATKCGFAFDHSTHELGYVAVKASQQGKHLSRHITAALLSEFGNRPLFATTSNPRMKSTLRNLGFVQRGKEWEGTGGSRLSCWLKEATPSF